MRHFDRNPTQFLDIMPDSNQTPGPQNSDIKIDVEKRVRRQAVSGKKNDALYNWLTIVIAVSLVVAVPVVTFFIISAKSGSNSDQNIKPIYDIGSVDGFYPANEPLKAGHIQVRIIRQRIGKVNLESSRQSEDDLLEITVYVSNTSENAKVDFLSWGLSLGRIFDSDASLVDNFGNTYRRVHFGFSDPSESTNKSAIYPGESVKDIIVFEAPVSNAKYLNLTLSAEAVGEEGDFCFRIPIDEIVKK